MRHFCLNKNTPLNFVVCGMLSSKDNFLHMKRQFSDNVFILIKKGTLNICANNNNYELSPNQFIVLKKEELHFGTKNSVGELEYYWVHFDDALEINNDSSLSLSYKYFIPETGTINNSNKIQLLFTQLLDFYMNDSSNQDILNFAVSLLMLELTAECKEKENQRDYPPVLYNAMSWIKANYSKNFSIQGLSEYLNYSSTHLSVLFKKNLNMSIIQYINHVRIETAKNLLTYFGLSVKECAWQCGFEDEKYFMKVFKTITGITPTEYKNTFYKKNIN